MSFPVTTFVRNLADETVEQEVDSWRFDQFNFPRNLLFGRWDTQGGGDVMVQDEQISIISRDVETDETGFVDIANPIIMSLC